MPLRRPTQSLGSASAVTHPTFLLLAVSRRFASSKQHKYPKFSEASINMAVADAINPRRPLKCPGGNRMTSQGIKSVLKVHSSGQLKRLDQRFILNLKLTHQIMGNLSEHLEGQMGGGGGGFGGEEGANSGGKLILEIGPGPGALTRSLLTRQTAGVLGVEVDPRFNSYLEQIHQQTGGKFQWANADIMSTDEYAIIKEHFGAYVARMEGEADTNNSNSNNDDDAHVDGGDFFGSTRAAASANSKRHAGASSVVRNGFHVPLRSTHRETVLKRRQHLSFGTGLHGATKQQQQQQQQAKKGAAEEDDLEDGDDDGFFEAGGAQQKKKSKDKAARQALSEEDKIKARWSSTAGSNVVVVSNLPFALTTGLLMRYSFDSYAKQGIYRFGRTPVYCLVPQLIANRLIALPPGMQTRHRESRAAGLNSSVNDERLLSRSYGRPSILFQNYFHVRVHRLFSEKTFYPPIDILGAFVQLTPRSTPLVDIEPATLIAFLNTTFIGKMRMRSVSTALAQAMPAELVGYALQQLRIDGAVAIGQLTVREVALLAKVWERYMLGTNQSMQEASERAKAGARAEREKEWAAEAEETMRREAEAAAAAASSASASSQHDAPSSSEAQPEGSSPSAAAASSAASYAPHDDGDDLLDIMFQSSSHLSVDSPPADAATSGTDAGGEKRRRGSRKGSFEVADGDGDEATAPPSREKESNLFVQKHGGATSADRIGAPIDTMGGLSPKEALMADAMEFFGYDDAADDGADDADLFSAGGSSSSGRRYRVGDYDDDEDDGEDGSTRSIGGGDGSTMRAKGNPLYQMLSEARTSGKSTYLRFKEEEEKAPGNGGGGEGEQR